MIERVTRQAVLSGGGTGIGRAIAARPAADGTEVSALHAWSLGLAQTQGLTGHRDSRCRRSTTGPSSPVRTWPAYAPAVGEASSR